ncbi:SET domain-containing protein [Botrytis cinerea]
MLPSKAIQDLVTILRHDFTVELNASLASLPPQSSPCLKIHAEICIDPSVPQGEIGGYKSQPIYLGSISLDQAEIHGSFNQQSTTPVATDPSLLPNNSIVEGLGSTHNGPELSNIHQTHPLEKKRKTIGGLTIKRGSYDEMPDDSSSSSQVGSSAARQLQTEFRVFPQRKKRNGHGIHQLQPSSIEKFVAGVWKQIYSNVELAPISLDSNCVPMIASGGSNFELFRAINSLCLRITTIARRYRSLETIIQAHWVDCFDHRVKEIGIQNPFLSNTETKMLALREACTVLKWSEKELRNRLAIWRGYKEIKDAGGWACLAFAGSGIYRFCKYRVGFEKNLVTRLERLQSSLEVAADTIHPEWRKLLKFIGIESQLAYTGHPHDWVVCDAAKPVTLKSTYTEWDPDFEFSHVEESITDEAAWGVEDPRTVEVASTACCHDCGYLQSNDTSINNCRCFPEVYGCCKTVPPVQVFRTPLGMNNGIIARCGFARGSAIGEFVGLITKGMEGKDVMQSKSTKNQYQIYQGRMGNHTRFVNHSCAPNSQFQKFHWLGTERIVLVSKGIEAGKEITVDYSHEYWKGLDKDCLCGELCCRYVRGRARSSAT